VQDRLPLRKAIGISKSEEVEVSTWDGPVTGDEDLAGAETGACTLGRREYVSRGFGAGGTIASSGISA